MALDSIKPEIEHLIEEKNWAALRRQLPAWEVPEIADLLFEVDEKDATVLFRSLPRAIMADVFSYLKTENQDNLLHALTGSETRHLLAELSPDDRTALLEELPAKVTLKLMQLLSHEDLKEARLLLGYPDESVGRLMTPDYVAVNAAITVAEAIDEIRHHGHDSETVNRIYVCDKDGVLLDDIVLRRVILARPENRLREIMDGSFVSLSAFDDREVAVQRMQKYDVVALPVVDSENILIGIVTFDDVMDVAEEEVTEDIQKAASVEPLKMSYRRASVWTLYRKRIVWLVVLVLLNLASTAVIASHEKTLAAIISLTVFIPLLLGTGGNAGAQSATIMLRALVTGDVELGEWFASFLKELIVGALLGLTLGFIGAGLGLFHTGIAGGFKIAAVVGITMICLIVVANTVGMTLPFILARLKLDPAVAGSPLITTIADVTGLLIYFHVAKFLLL